MILNEVTTSFNKQGNSLMPKEDLPPSIWCVNTRFLSAARLSGLLTRAEEYKSLAVAYCFSL